MPEAERTMVLRETTRPVRSGGQAALTLGVLGGMLETGNLGVAALGLSAIKGIRLAFPDCRVIVQTVETDPVVRVPSRGGAIEAEAMQLYSSRGLRGRFGTSHLKTVYRMARRLPRPISTALIRSNRTLEQLTRCDAVLDVCGGDSFADFYGARGFEFQVQPKLLIEELGRPLVLLPQTYGPFQHEQSIAVARRIIEYSALVATREVAGIEELRRMCGGALHDRVVCCPDMAFLLDPLPVEEEREPFLRESDGRPLIGLNVSGLLHLSNKDFGLREPYPRLIEAIAEWAINRCGGRLLLVPHVLSHRPPSDALAQLDRSREVSDTVACGLVMKQLEARYGERIGCLGWPYDACQTKYFVGRCDFFIGARMHACIGAISQAVPTATLAYSKKALGVLSHVEMQEAVVDLREVSIAECMERLKRLFDRRREVRGFLEEKVPQVQAEVRRFFVEHLPRALGVNGAFALR